MSKTMTQTPRQGKMTSQRLAHLVVRYKSSGTDANLWRRSPDHTKYQRPPCMTKLKKITAHQNLCATCRGRTPLWRAKSGWCALTLPRRVVVQPDLGRRPLVGDNIERREGEWGKIVVIRVIPFKVSQNSLKIFLL